MARCRRRCATNDAFKTVFATVGFCRRLLLTRDVKAFAAAAALDLQHFATSTSTTSTTSSTIATSDVVPLIVDAVANEERALADVVDVATDGDRDALDAFLGAADDDDDVQTKTNIVVDNNNNDNNSNTSKSEITTTTNDANNDDEEYFGNI
jgi:hypothetical protein